MFSCGDAAFTIVCAEDISLEALATVQALRRFLECHSISGVREIVPAFTTLTLVCDIAELCALSASPFDYILHHIQIFFSLDLNSRDNSLDFDANRSNSTSKYIPVCYDEVYAPDIKELASWSGMSIEDVILLHTQAEYRVAMLGFTPGFPYLLGLNPLLAMPRKHTPRQYVAAGAVGIAGMQTGLYPLASPGGWNIIGQTPLRLFAPESSSPTLLKQGENVRFYAISPMEFEEIASTVLPSKPLYESPDTANVTILQIGLQATIQDAGRMGWREYGVPQSGAMDVDACLLANILVGNSKDEAVVEVLPGGFAMRFERDTVIALTGADMDAEVLGVRNDVISGSSVRDMVMRVPCCRPVLVRSGTILRMHNPKNGLRSYIALAGGIDTPLVLGSRSTYERAGLGGIAGRGLRKGDVLSCGIPSAHNASIMNSLLSYMHITEMCRNEVPTAPCTVARWSLGSETLMQQSSCTLRIIPGAEYNELTQASKQMLYASALRVLSNSDRMGLRLEMPLKQALVRSTEKQLISRAVMPGTVQLPPDGQPIILLSDSQTTGGYPVIAHLCSVDLPRAAQLRPNDRIVFEECTLEEAQKLYIERESLLKRYEWGVQYR